MTPLLLQAPFVNRTSFGRFLTEKKLMGTGVEIGTDRADFAYWLLKEWKCQKFHCVDPYHYHYDEDDPTGRRSLTERLSDEDAAIGTLSQFPQAVMQRVTSEEFSCTIRDDTLDFCYIDGDHTLQSVRRDVRVWWKKIRPGGILAGHDLVIPGEPTSMAENVQQAVLGFFGPRWFGPVFIVLEDDRTNPWSWYVEKK